MVATTVTIYILIQKGIGHMADTFLFLYQKYFRQKDRFAQVPQSCHTAPASCYKLLPSGKVPHLPPSFLSLYKVLLPRMFSFLSPAFAEALHIHLSS